MGTIAGDLEIKWILGLPEVKIEKKNQICQI